MRRIVPVLVAGLLVAAFSAPVSASYSATWHRNSFGVHERLVCTVTSGLWQCRQDVVVASSQQGNQNQGNSTGEYASFRGSEQAGSIPPWAAALETHAPSYVVGAITYGMPNGPFNTLWDELILTDGQGVAPLYAYLTGPAVEYPFPVVCPWYRTWQEAQANPPGCFEPAD